MTHLKLRGTTSKATICRRGSQVVVWGPLGDCEGESRRKQNAVDTPNYWCGLSLSPVLTSAPTSCVQTQETVQVSEPQRASSPGSLGDLIRFWVSAALLDLGPEPQQGGRTTANTEWDRCLHSWSLKQKSHLCLCFSCRNKSTQKGGLLLLRLHVCSYRLYSDCWYTVVLHKYYSRSTTGGTAQEHSTTECRRSVTRWKHFKHSLDTMLRDFVGFCS